MRTPGPGVALWAEGRPWLSRWFPYWPVLDSQQTLFLESVSVVDSYLAD